MQVSRVLPFKPSKMHYDGRKELYQLATRLFHTPANSVPSERSFSSMGILHSKSRNRLTVERVSKMLYIQVNRRTLGRVGKPVAQLEEELEITDDEDDEDLILCRYSVAESTGVSGTVDAGSGNTFLCEIQMEKDCTSAGYGHFILVHRRIGLLGDKKPYFSNGIHFKSFQMISKRIPV